MWATALAGKPKESRPKAEDTLLGFAYVPLGEILSDKNEVYVRYGIAYSLTLVLCSTACQMGCSRACMTEHSEEWLFSPAFLRDSFSIQY